MSLVRTISCLSILAFAVPAQADHGGPTATSVAELVYQLGERLDDVARDFGFEPGELPMFDEKRFNQLLRDARNSLDLAVRHIDRDQVCQGFYKLARSTSRLESATDYGIEQNMSGWGFADDLASFTSFVAEVFLEDLIVLAGQDGADANALSFAIEAEMAGDLLRGSEEWAAATDEFASGVCALL
jgi:hypothetical protein